MKSYIGLIIGTWMGLGITVMFSYMMHGLGSSFFINWDKLSNKGAIVVLLLILPWIALILVVGGALMLTIQPFKEFRDVIFYSSEDRTTPLFKFLRRPFRSSKILIREVRELQQN